MNVILYVSTRPTVPVFVTEDMPLPVSPFAPFVTVNVVGGTDGSS